MKQRIKKLIFFIGFAFFIALNSNGAYGLGDRKAFIHMAPPKCGNTIIQKTLLYNRKRLASVGVFYLQRVDYFYEGLGQYFYDLYDGKTVNREQAKKALVRLIKTLPSKGSVIVSNENFVGLSYPDLKKPNMRALRKEGCFKFLKEVFEELGFQVIPIFYIKSQDKFLESNYTQLVAEQGTSSFEKWMCRIDPPAIEWLSLIEDLEAVYEGKIIIKAFEEVYEGRTQFVDSFFEAIKKHDKNIPYSFKLEVKQMGVYGNNLSYSGIGITVVKFLNRYLSKQRMQWMRPFLQTVLGKKYFPGVCLFKKPFRAFLKKHYRPSNLYLLQKYALNKYKKYYMPLCN